MKLSFYYSRKITSPAVRAGFGVVYALFGIAMIGAPSPSRAALSVSEDSPHASLLRRVYFQIPYPWRTHDTLVVRELPDREMDRRVTEDFRNPSPAWDDDDSAVDGFYSERSSNGSGPSITLRRSLPDDEAVYVFLHEYGHSVWYKQLTRTQRADYTRLWKLAKRYGHLITEYAGDSVEEGFAEVFAHYLRKPRLLQRIDPDSLRFFDDMQQNAFRAATRSRTARRASSSD